MSSVDDRPVVIHDGPEEGSSRGSSLPPQDLPAERSVLGAMLLSKDAIADVVEGMRAEFFYRPAHQAIYHAILELYGRGEPADFITVADELAKAGALERVGGAAYITGLTRDLPSAVNATYHAEIVRQRALLRKLIEASTRILQLAYDGAGEADDIVNRAQAEMYEISSGRRAEDYVPLADILESAIAEIEAIANHDGDMIGVPTGLRDLDTLTQGLHPGQLVIIAARPAIGKALALDTPLATPSGWSAMGRIAVGDELFAPDGSSTRVVAATEVMVGRPCYRVQFSDDTSIVADEDHLWVTVTARVPEMAGAAWAAGGAVRTTGEIARTLSDGHVVPSVWPGPDADARLLDAWMAGDRVIVAAEPVASVPVRCIEVDREDGMFLAGRSMIPTHNSTLGLDIARAASVKHGLASVIFSLEMSRTEIMMRLLSSEGSIQLNNIRSGRMGAADWQKIAHRQDALRDAPLYIDDSPNMTMTEIRAKCRRLKQQHDLRLVVVDYMQLMTSGKKVESRQQEVSEFSRALKLLAKELEVPVIAISQLNRGPEQRTDKKPMLSDLRESGCLTADTRVIRADTGAEATLGELHEAGARNVPVWSLDASLRYRARTLTRVFPTGHREVFEVRLASGRVLKATANHPLLTVDGWVAAGELGIGRRVAVPRHVPPPLEIAAMDDDEVVLLAHLLADGRVAPREPVRLESLSMDNLEAVQAAAWRRFGIRAMWDDTTCALRLYSPCALTDGVRHPIVEWFAGLGLYGSEARVPDCVFSAPKEQAAVFLRHLWATSGARLAAGQVRLSLPSRRLADDVARLLLRFGLIGTVSGSAVSVDAPADQQVFWRRIGGFGRFAEVAEAMAVGSAAASPRAPGDLWKQVGRVLAADAGRGEPSGERTAAVAAVLDDADLELVATNDVRWDEITSMRSLGFFDVFDATVAGTHNFIADGVVVHNSLEQDADVVVLIHREDFYDKENRPGEADLIVAKHRNGPTDTIAVSFQGHYSRFTDLAG